MNDTPDTDAAFFDVLETVNTRHDSKPHVVDKCERDDKPAQRGD